jgi:uncharacterized ion transporter superfamily protein YfcC
MTEGGTGRSLHPLTMMILAILVSFAITYIAGSGRFERHGEVVVAGTFHEIPKVSGAAAFFAPGIAPPAKDAPVAHAASVFSLLAAISGGLIKNVTLVVLVLMIGAMFGVLRSTGAVEAGIDRLLDVTGGRKYVLVPVLMILLGMGSTFLGMIPEYLVLIPIIGLVGERLGYSRLFGLAVVTVASKIGYLTSVTNPFALPIAQSLAHVPLFSGIEYRAFLFAFFLAIGILYVVLRLHPERAPQKDYAGEKPRRLSCKHSVVLSLLGAAAVLLVVGFTRWSWGIAEVCTLYTALPVLFAIANRSSLNDACEAYVGGMRNMVLSALLVGLAGAVQTLLENSFVLDDLIYRATELLHGQPTAVSAVGIMAIEIALGIFVPSTSGKVAMSMPILAPIAHLSGVSGQTTVLAFLMGNGLTNMIAPTNGMLLAFIAAARVSFGEWARFVLPLFALLVVLAIGALVVADMTGY